MFKKTPRSWEWSIVCLHPVQGISGEDSGAARDLRGGCDVCECVCLGKRKHFDVSRTSAGVIAEVSSAAS